MTDKPQMPPVKIAFVIDGEVVEVLHTGERLGSILLSEPLIIDASDKVVNGEMPNLVGFLYNPETKEFTEKPKD
ncbi:MAG: hypothetical protein WCH21_05615 [Bacteroidota bacterium]